MSISLSGKDVLRYALKGLAICLAFFIVLSVLSVLVFRWIPVPVSSVMIQREAEALMAGKSLSYHYDWVSYDQISPQLKMAVITSEDQLFPFHHGFDQHQIEMALQSWRAGDALRGASTLSQQTSKNIWLWTDSDWVRKGVEAWFTVLIEAMWPKHRILEMYLNLAEWGPGIYGAQAAAEHYFGTSAARLTQRQAELLVSVLPAPLMWSPVRPDQHILEHIGWISHQEVQLGGLRYLENVH